MVLKKLSQILPALVLSVVSGSLLVAVTASATQPSSASKKVFVCKYVGKPGVNERLQTGQNPISVSTHAIQKNEWNGAVPGWFSDAQNRSYVLAYNNGQAKPSANTCPKPEVPATPGHGDSTTPQVLGTSATASSALPTTIPSTGSTANKALLIILASLAAYGAAYSLLGRHKVSQDV